MKRVSSWGELDGEEGRQKSEDGARVPKGERGAGCRRLTLPGGIRAHAKKHKSS